uniref:Uncharacterized protein n=1 Tax=Anas platyrhynchos platyrhynchos TaxID=8840 RepID=A0A493TNT2_ANAPP
MCFPSFGNAASQGWAETLPSSPERPCRQGKEQLYSQECNAKAGWLLAHLSFSFCLSAYFCFLVTALGVTAGAHRLWSHRSYKAKLPLRIFLAAANSMAFQVGSWLPVPVLVVSQLPCAFIWGILFLPALQVFAVV